MAAGRYIPEVEDPSPDGPICPRYELPAAWCAHCRAPAPPTRSRRKHHVRSHKPEQAAEVGRHGPAVAHMSYARRGGGCWLCREPFAYAELVGVTAAGHYVCQACL